MVKIARRQKFLGSGLWGLVKVTFSPCVLPVECGMTSVSRIVYKAFVWTVILLMTPSLIPDTWHCMYQRSCYCNTSRGSLLLVPIFLLDRAPCCIPT